MKKLSPCCHVETHKLPNGIICPSINGGCGEYITKGLEKQKLNLLLRVYKIQAEHIYKFMKKHKINIKGKVFKNGKV